MSLIDLKKGNKSKGKKKKFTVDEFISDADNYAKGKPKVVNNVEHEKVVRGKISDAKDLLALSDNHGENLITKHL